MDGNSDNTIRETAEFETNEVEKLGARVSELERELISTKNHLENVEGKLKRETEELSKIEPERNRLQVANLELIATIESQKSEIAKEQREAQSSAKAALTWKTRCEEAEEENLRLKLQINDLKYGVGSTSRVPNIPTIPNSPNQGTTAPSNNSNSLNPTHATIFFGIGVVVGFVCLGLGQLIFGSGKTREIKELKAKQEAR